MIVNSSGHITPISVHDHESTQRRPDGELGKARPPRSKPGGLLLRIAVVTAPGSQEPWNPAQPAPAAGASAAGASAAGASAGASAAGGSAARTGRDLAAQIGLVARGDAAAFDAVFEQLGPSVFGVVKRVIRDPAQSEEVTQEVL